MRTSIKAFSVIPHVDPAALAGRTLSTGTFYTDGEWTLWTSIDGKFHPLKIVDLAEGVYFGDAAAAPHDLGLNALNLIAQHTCNGTTMRPFIGIWDDIYNIAASIAKIDLISEARSTLGTKAGRMVITEVEYLAIQCRSIFDYVQEILRSQWSTVYSLEDGSKSKRKLPGSFGDVVLENGQPRTSQDIRAKYLLPTHLADVYAYHAPFFSTLKKMRDAIVHNAANPKNMFTTENGPYIDASVWPFNTFTTWQAAEFLPNNLAPLKPALGQMILRTLSAAEDIHIAYAQLVQLGPPICPRHRLYLRASCGVELTTLLRDANSRSNP